MKDLPRAVEAFIYFIQAFPDNAQTPSALAQRALAYQQDKNYDVAIADLNTIVTKYPQAREREAALQQKALIQGQQGNAKGMSDTFRQLLKEFPKSAAAGQAQYYIGKSVLEAKDYKAAITALNAARQLDKAK
jgi:TolA-binding protein